MEPTSILHNANCSTSRVAIEAAADLEAPTEVRHYLKKPLTKSELRDLLAILEDQPQDLVRRDGYFVEQGLTESDIQTAEQVATVLAAHPRLMQRPVLQRGNRAIIGRPKDRAREFLAEA